MPSILLRTLHLLTHLSPAQTYEVGTSIIFTLQMSSLRYRQLSSLPKVTEPSKGEDLKQYDIYEELNNQI